MNPELASKFSVTKSNEKQRNKSTLKKPNNVKSHIVFAGDPAFHQESFDYVPLGKRKKIFSDKSTNILPPDLLEDQQPPSQHNQIAKNQKIINQNIITSFDRQFGTVRPHAYSNQKQNLRLKSFNFRQETYFEPNNLQADINFGIIQEEEPNYAFNSSKASETTQKKGGVIFQNNFASPMDNAGNNLFGTNKFSVSKMPQINFSYQGKQPSKPSDQAFQSRVERRISTVRVDSPPKSRSRTIFLNEGGVMVPKNKKIPLHDSTYFDFHGIENETYHEQNPGVNGVIAVIASEGLKQGETPEFNKKNSSNLKSNQMINNSLINQFNRLQSESQQRGLNELNYQGLGNHNNTSIISYKSIQKQFETDRMGKPPIQKENQINDSMTHKQQQQSIVVKALQQIGQRGLKKNDQSQSMSFQEERQSMFDQLLKDREKIFNKNKIQEEAVVPRRIKENRNSILRTEGAQSEFKSIQKPSDFITDSKAVPKGLKRNINIKNVAGNDYEKVRHLYKEQESQLNGSKPMMESKVKRLQVNQINQAKKQAEAVKSKSGISQKTLLQKPESAKPFNSQLSKQTNSQRPQIEEEDQQENKKQQRSRPHQSEQQAQSEAQNHRKNKKRRKKKTKQQNDSDLEQYLQKQKSTIHLNQTNRSNGQNALTNSKKKKVNNQQLKVQNNNPDKQSSSHYDTSYTLNDKPTIVMSSIESWSPEQRQLLNQMGIQLIGNTLINNNIKPMPNSHHANQSWPNQYTNQQIGVISGFPHYMSGNQTNSNQANRAHLDNAPLANNMVSSMFNANTGLAQYHLSSKHQDQNESSQTNPQNFQKAFQQINNVLYKQLLRVLYPLTSTQNNSKPQNLTNNQFCRSEISYPHQNGQNITHNNYKIQQVGNNSQLREGGSRMEKETGSTKSLRNGDLFNQITEPYRNEGNINFCGLSPSFTSSNRVNWNNHQSGPPDQWKNNGFKVNLNQPGQYQHGRQHYDLHQNNSHPNQKPNNEPNHNRMGRPSHSPNNNQNKSHSRQQSYFRSSLNDQTHYYSFYHDDNPQAHHFNHNSKPQFIVDHQSYYPIKQLNKNKNNKAFSPLKSKFDIPHKQSINNSEIHHKKKFLIPHKKEISNSELQALFNKIQQLSKELDQQLPLIRAQIQQNQQQIRKIQTNLLIKNTAEQHNLIKILQKMRIKEVQLKDKQLQVRHKDHELSMCQEQLHTIQQQFKSRKQINKDLQMEAYFENRLHKIKNYNQNLCSKIAHSKKTSFII